MKKMRMQKKKEMKKQISGILVSTMLICGLSGCVPLQTKENLLLLTA